VCGHGYGSVIKAIGATPEIVLIGFIDNIALNFFLSSSEAKEAIVAFLGISL